MSKISQQIRLRPGFNIGELAAEFDMEYRSSCFIDVPALEQILHQKNNRSILLARTGAGKSAILLRLEEIHENVSRIDPKEASFQFVSSSTIVRLLASIGVDMHIFYEFLWKHVLCIHIITECLGVRSDDKLQGFWRSLDKVLFADRRKGIVRDYLLKWEGRFWISADEVSREIIDEVSNKLAGKLNVSCDLLETELASTVESSQRQVKLLRNRAQQIIDSLQIKELNQTIAALAELIGKREKIFYILIDDLDKHWVSEDFQYPLIRALIDSLQTFGKIPGVRIIIAMREDLYESVIASTAERHFQSEKLEGMIVRVRWTKDQLRRLIDARIQHLFENRYTKSDVRLIDVMPEQIRGTDISEYLVSRTLYRPRDAIDFVNKILAKNVSEKLPLSQKQVTGSEPEYSRSRFSSLRDEWRSLHPLLNLYMEVLATQKQEIALTFFNEEALLNLAAEVEGLQRGYSDEVERLSARAYDRDKEQQFSKLSKELICCLYKVGAIGIKLGKNMSYRYSFRDEPLIGPSQLSQDCKVMVVPMLSCALNTQGQIRLAA